MNKKIRLEYIDLLKFLSIFAIIAVHVFKVWQYPQIWNIDIYAFSNFVKFGVPVFVMISGALLLNKDIEIIPFLKKRIARIVYPFIFYYIITSIFIVFIMNSTHDQVTNIFAFRWYFWMIIGVYLSIPIINKFIQNASEFEIKYFLYLFLIASVFYDITYYFGIEQYLYLNLFVSPFGYLVLGYYLSKHDFKISTNRLIAIAIILFILATFAKFCGQMNIIPMTENYLHSSSPIVSSWLDLNIFEIIQASSVFLICRYIYESGSGLFSYVKRFLQKGIVSKFILSVSRASYGMYLINLIPCFLYYYLRKIPFSGTEICMLILALSVATFIISWLVIVILGKIPYIKYLSGYY